MIGHANPKSLVALNDRIIEICAETFGDSGTGSSQLSTQLTDFGVEVLRLSPLRTNASRAWA